MFRGVYTLLNRDHLCHGTPRLVDFKPGSMGHPRWDWVLSRNDVLCNGRFHQQDVNDDSMTVIQSLNGMCFCRRARSQVYLR